MTLRDWIRQQGCTVREFADHIGKSNTIVSKWVYGQRQPSLPNAIMIERATGGLVLASDLLTAHASSSNDAAARFEKGNAAPKGAAAVEVRR